MFLVPVLRENANIQVFGLNAEVQLSWAKGQIGAVPVFENKEDAEKYADGRCEVIEVKELGDGK